MQMRRKSAFISLKIRNQLNAIKPLIISAAKAQPKTNRIQFHYTSYFDMSEKRHNGLLEDINAIEDGINVKLKQMPREPNIFLPIKGDYLDHDHLSKSK